MTEPINEPSKVICPICGINKIDGVFYWSNPSKNMNAPVDAVYTRVCSYVKDPQRRQQCINPTGKHNDSYRYLTEILDNNQEENPL